jgi:hypothetical protein
VPTYQHYGQKCLKILNGQGVMRNFKVRPNQNYELTGWVNVATGSQPLQVWVEYWTGPNPVTTWPIQWNQLTTLLSSFSTNISPTSGNWQLVDIKVPPRTETNLWIRIHFGLAGQSVTAYADDIRFGPANSLITTTYYDTLWRQPILSVDANSLPGRLVKYDQYGRPFRWYKIDGAKTRNFPLYDKLVQRKTYHLYGD